MNPNLTTSSNIIIVSAPSGAGKSTIVNHLLSKYNSLEFSISATSRAPRGEERDGKEYFFYSAEEFKEMIEKGLFIEYEEVYQGVFYGTLKSEVERIVQEGKFPIFDIDVKGGINLKKLYGKRALSLFIMPPSIEVLKNRLVSRGTENRESIDKRISKAQEEIGYAKQFDKIIINDNLENSLKEAELLIESLL